MPLDSPKSIGSDRPYVRADSPQGALVCYFLAHGLNWDKLHICAVPRRNNIAKLRPTRPERSGNSEQTAQHAVSVAVTAAHRVSLFGCSSARSMRARVARSAGVSCLTKSRSAATRDERGWSGTGEGGLVQPVVQPTGGSTESSRFVGDWSESFEVRDQEVAGSNPVSPTRLFLQRVSEKRHFPRLEVRPKPGVFLRKSSAVSHRLGLHRCRARAPKSRPTVFTSSQAKRS